MTLGLKIGCGLYAALLMFLGGQWWFTFEEMSVGWVVQAIGPQGVNNLLADMGGLFFGGAIMIALGLRAGHSTWLLATALLMAVAASGRLYGYAAFGYVPETLAPLIFEIGSCALLVFTHLRMDSEHPIAVSKS